MDSQAATPGLRHSRAWTRSSGSAWDRARWSHGCECDQCRQAQNTTVRTYERAKARDRLSIGAREQLLAAIYSGQVFGTALRDLA